MFVLGIGKNVDSSELNQIASGPNNVFRVDSFKDLYNKANEAKRGICILGILGKSIKFQLENNAMSSQARKPKVKWTEQMNKDVLECKKKAQELVSSENPPCNENGRKRGYIDVMKELWDDMVVQVMIWGTRIYN